MTLSFKVFGFEVASVDLDIEREEVQASPQNLVVKAVKKTSWAWVRGMMA